MFGAELLLSCWVVPDSLQPHECLASLSITISWSLLKLMSIKSVRPSKYLILCRPLLLLLSIFPTIRVFSKESALRIRWPKYWSFSFSINPSNKYSGLISFRIDWFDLLEVQGTLKSLLQQHKSKASNPQRKKKKKKSIKSLALSLLYGGTLTFVHDYLKNHSFDYMDLCWQSDVSAFQNTV